MDEHSTTDDDLLMDFVHGLLTDEDRRLVLRRAQADPAFESRLRSLSAAYERARAEGVPSQARPPRPRPAGRHWHVTAGVIAAAAVLVVMLLPSGRISVERGPLYLLPVEGHLLQTRSDAGEATVLRTALQAYGRGDFATATRLLRDADLPAGMGDLAHIYLASSALESGEAGQAKQTILALELSTLPQPWRNRARWILYLAERESGDAVAARFLLDQLAAESDEVGELARQERDRLH